MELLTKLAFIALYLDALLIAGIVSIFLYFFSQWIQFDNINEKVKKLISNGEVDELKKNCSEYIEKGSKIKQYCGFNGMAMIELRKKNLDLAEDYAQKAIDLMPGETIAYETMINIMLCKKDIHKGFYYAISGITSAIMCAEIATAAGMLFTYDKQFNEAIKLFQIAQDKNSQTPVPTVCIAIVHYLNKNNTQAIDFIRQARKKIDLNTSLYSDADDWAKGLLAIMSGDFKEAKYIFEYYSETSYFGPVFDLILERIKQVFNPES